MSDTTEDQQIEAAAEAEAPFEIKEAGADDGHMLTESELHELLAQSAEPAETRPDPTPEPEPADDLAAGFSGAASVEPEAVPEPPATPAPQEDHRMVISSAIGAAELLTVEQATRALAVPLEMRDEALVVLAASPVDQPEIERLKEELGHDVEVQEGSISDVVTMLRQTYGSDQDAAARKRLVASSARPSRSRFLHWLKGLAS